MEELDQISSLDELEKNESLYIGLFQEACLEMNTNKALDYALKAYLCGDISRERIIKEVFVVCVRDKGLANPNLFPQIYQLLSVVMKRGSEEDEKKEDIEEEEWVLLDDYENYSFSSYGRLKMNDEIIPPVKNGKKLALRVDTDVFLDIDILVATTFVSNTEGYKIVHHINGDLSDSRYNNLEWVKKVPKVLPELQPIIKLRPEQITRDTDLSSYVYRFMLAVWLVASSPCSSVNDYASYLFEDILDTEEEYVTEFGNVEEVKIKFHTAVSSKNIADSLYYSKVLTNHPDELKKSVPWKKVKKPYIAIWDTFSVILKNSPSHIKIYLKCMIDLATSEIWVDDERHNFFHIHFIHMFCLDPITLNLNFNKGLKKRPIQTKWGEIKGTFVKDFIEATYKNKKRTYEAKIESDVEPVLFPINIESILLEPRDEKYHEVSNIDENILELNDTFLSIYENILSTENDVSTIIKIDVLPYITNKIQKVEEFAMYSELSLFYLFFAFHENAKIHDFIQNHFEDFSEIFQTNPFDCESDLHGTYFISFVPYLLELTKCTENSLFYRALLPKNKEKEKYKSSLDYRTVTNNYKGITVTKKTV